MRTHAQEVVETIAEYLGELGRELSKQALYMDHERREQFSLTSMTEFGDVELWYSVPLLGFNPNAIVPDYLQVMGLHYSSHVCHICNRSRLH